MKRKPDGAAPRFPAITPSRRALPRASARRFATPSRTSSAWRSRAPSARTPTCSCPGASDPSGPAGTGRPRSGRRRRPSRRAYRDAVAKRFGPDHVAIAFDHRVRAAQFERFFGIKRGVDAAVDDPRASLPGDLARPHTRAAHCRCGCRCRRHRRAECVRGSSCSRVSSQITGSPKRPGSRRRAHTASAA